MGTAGIYTAFLYYGYLQEDVLMFKKITFGLGGVVPLMQYISGRKYEQLAELCGEARHL